ncbi:MAG: hypothetical protein ACRYGG_01055 [Janthinobacterium lividum]
MDDQSEDWQAEGTTAFKLRPTGIWRRGKEVKTNEFTIQVRADSTGGRTEAEAAEIAEGIARWLRQS